MLRPEDARFITEAITPLAAPLHESLEEGRQNANDHYDRHKMAERCFLKGRTDLTRDHALARLLKLDLAGWTPSRRGSGRILLSRNAMSIRLLHRSPFGDTVPPPGNNRARINYYRNPTPDLIGVEASQLLAVWDVDRKGEVVIRIVRPTKSFRAGAVSTSDYDMLLPRSAEDLSKLTFESSDEEIDLGFLFKDDEEQEEGEEGSA
ncbi:hypothetical protein [Streptomyces lushanensis]|uniref:hypothetical protein n=1 Tax=Streptomyces lushanensis TaxID=1434255 RepID=UPI000833B86D|nr:hypothetical protein [Streptomyces lushanensis]